MTGEEFEKQIKAIGLKKSEVAKKLGVDPDTVTARCKDIEVPSLYAYAIVGLSAKPILDQLKNLDSLICSVDNSE